MPQYKGAIIVPTTHPDSAHVMGQLRQNFEEKFGGYSVYEGHGGWVAPDGERYEEDHARIEAVGSVEDGFTSAWFRKQARYVKRELGEEAVTVEIHETDMFFV